MGFLNRVKQAVRPQPKPSPAPNAKNSNAGPMIAWSGVGQPKWTPRRYDSLAEEGFRKNVIAYRCVIQIATACAAVPWLLYEDVTDVEIDQHPLLDLLKHPNPLQDGVSFMEAVYADLEIAGNAYIEAVRPHDNAPPVELYVLRPDRMKVIPGATGFPQGYQYNVNGQVTGWASDPVIHPHSIRNTPMAIRDLLRTVLVSTSLPPAIRVNGTATGSTVDLRGFDGAMITVAFGAYTDGTHTPSVLQSVDGVTFTACVYGTDLDATTNLAAVSSSSGANTIQQIGYIGSQRYLAVVMTTTGATSGAASYASITAGYPRNAPTQ